MGRRLFYEGRKDDSVRYLTSAVVDGNPKAQAFVFRRIPDFSQSHRQKCFSDLFSLNYPIVQNLLTPDALAGSEWANDGPEYLRLSAIQGNSIGLYLYSRHLFRTGDYALALDYLWRSADRKSEPARIELGQVYEAGNNVISRDLYRAIVLYRSAHKSESLAKSIGECETRVPETLAGGVFPPDFSAAGKKIVYKHFSWSCLSFFPCVFHRDFSTWIEPILAVRHCCLVPVRCVSTKLDSPDPPYYVSDFKANGSLDGLFRSLDGGRISEFWNPTNVCITIFRIVVGMRYLHARSFWHGHLHPRNLLFDGEWNVFIADFAARLFVDEDLWLERCEDVVSFVAPEVFDSDDDAIRHSFKVDVFSFGVILFEMLLRCHTFIGGAEPVQTCFVSYRRRIPDWFTEYGRDLVQRCWSEDPKTRPTFDGIFEELMFRYTELLPSIDGDKGDTALIALLDAEIDSRD
jgi:serine/threonine protein kinase